MARKSAYLRIALESVRVQYNGDERVEAGAPPRGPSRGGRSEEDEDNVLVASLEYPRSGAPQVTSTKSLDLPSGYDYRFDPADFWESGLFKEEVYGETKLTLVVSDRDKRSKIFRWFRKIFGGALSSYLSPMVNGISNVFLGSVASDLQGRMKEAVDPGDDKFRSTPIATTGPIFIQLTDEGIDARHDGQPLARPSPQVRVEVPMVAPMDLTQRRHKGGVVIAKDDPNGVVVLRISMDR
ncbi:MAG TPA: hypothetical protein VFV10_06440 [Gammaproteobacteria bacterium]|nr:hypothetical protein [Gammaproteobacteria bacterium]